MEKIRTFEDLKVWQRAHKFVLLIYKLSKAFPPEERYGLVSQIRRAAVSIPGNILEGHKRKNTREYVQFINIAASSLAEVKYFILLARDLVFLPAADYREVFELADGIGKMLNGLHAALIRRKYVS